MKQIWSLPSWNLIFLPSYLESNLNSSSSIFSKLPVLWIYFSFLSEDTLLNKLGKEIMFSIYEELPKKKKKVVEFVELGISYVDYCLFSFLIEFAIILLACLTQSCLATYSFLQLPPKQSFGCAQLKSSRSQLLGMQVNAWVPS